MEIMCVQIYANELEWLKMREKDDENKKIASYFFEIGT